ncbi:MAG: hypothetical protein HY943_17820 [Gammaproteobacteria bacterium]|nr:hypothetical protein [Gammaproteobacteria bacterium]
MFEPQGGDYFDIVGADHLHHLTDEFASFLLAPLARGLASGHEIVTAGGHWFYRLEVLAPSTVPLPPAWVMLGSAGAFLRRRPPALTR